MRPAAVDRMTPQMPDFTADAFHFVQTPSRRTVAALLAFLVPAAALLLFPFYLLASAAFADQGLRDLVVTRPLATAQIVTGLAFWVALLGFPIYRLLDTLTRTRTIDIGNGTVRVEDRVFGRAEVWTGHVSEFEGVAHYLRASLGVVRHEMILVHPDRERSLLIAIADRLMQSDLDRAALRLGLPEIPAASYRAAPAAPLRAVAA